MGQVVIPSTIEKAQEALGGLGGLLTAKEWERAAIVFAFTQPGAGTGSNQHVRKSGQALGIREFARFNIAGLRDAETVAWVRQAWQDAIDDGMAAPVLPGQSTDTPNREFPKHPRTRSSIDGFGAQLRKSPEAVRDLVRSDPQLAATLAEQVVNTPAVRAAVEHRLVANQAERTATDWQEPRGTDLSGELRRGVNALMPVLHAMRDGHWEPDHMERTMLQFLAKAFEELAGGNTPSASLFDEIEAYISGART